MPPTVPRVQGVGVPIAAFELEFRRLPFALPAASEQADTASKPDSANVVINSLLMCSPILEIDFDGRKVDVPSLRKSAV